MSTVKKNGWIFSPASMNFLDEFFPIRSCCAESPSHPIDRVDHIVYKVEKELRFKLDEKTQSLVNVNVNRVLYLIDF